MALTVSHRPDHKGPTLGNSLPERSCGIICGVVSSRHYSASGVTIRGAFWAVIVKSKRTAHDIFSFQTKTVAVPSWQCDFSGDIDTFYHL